jgi:hypothetical protein
MIEVFRRRRSHNYSRLVGVEKAEVRAGGHDEGEP